MPKFKQFSGQRTFFGDKKKLDKLEELGDRLLMLDTKVNWDIFRPLLVKHLYRVNEQGGRPPYDYVLMMKILILQRYYNVSDMDIEYQLNDRLSFQRFLGIGIDDDVPDESTISHFKEQLAKYGLVKKLFRLFLKEIQSKGIVGTKGSIVDASFVEVPRQRNTREENKAIKEGKIPEDWKNKHKIAQKDIDARWTKKNEETHFGYKNHVKADAESKIITNYTTTDASVHDSQELANLLEKSDTGKPLYADSAYKSKKIDQLLRRKQMKNKIIERAYRNTVLTQKQIRSNKLKSSIRVRVEHIFGFIEKTMKGSIIRSIGKQMAETNIGLMNLTYNMFRAAYLT